MTTNDSNDSNDYEGGESPESGTFGFPPEWYEDDSIPVVELRPAYTYICEHCGSTNYVDVVIREQRDTMSIMVPSFVRCPDCNGVNRSNPMSQPG
jgi:DNA-directed RNA polymerase subunit RPC12/RpoP